MTRSKPLSLKKSPQRNFKAKVKRKNRPFAFLLFTFYLNLCVALKDLQNPYERKLSRLSFTDVVVSGNMRDARVFVTIEGSENDIKSAMSALLHASTYVRQQVALNLNLNHAPHLHFVRDTIEENATRVEEILGTLEIKEDENSQE